jgi:LuxR family quorum-sensing system transcriptional regulator CciR
MTGGLIRLAEQFTEKAVEASDIPRLAAHLEDVGRELGFRYFALVHHVSLRRSAPRLIESSNYPPVWSEMFVGRHFFVDDPVLHASQRTAAAFAWHDVGRLLPLNERHRAILAQSRREGMGEGITIPANVPGEPTGSCSFATRSGLPLPCRSRLFAAQLIGLHAFERARDLNGLPRSRDQVPHLSPREEDCLRLLVAGASDKLIARQLKLSPETTRRYIKTARAAYGAATRTELVVRALRDGLVSFDDAIPPDG